MTWWFPFDNVGRQFGLAIKVCAIDVLESISIAKALAYRNSYDLKCASLFFPFPYPPDKKYMYDVISHLASFLVDSTYI